MHPVFRYTKFIVLLPLVMVLCTVLIVNDELINGVVSGKYFWFYAWIGVASLVTSIQFFANRQPLRASVVDVLALLFWIVSIFAHLINANEINTKFISFLLLGVLYLLFRISLTQHVEYKYFFVISILSLGLIEAIWGLRQLYGFTLSQHHLYKTTGSFFNPGPYAGYIAVIAPMAFAYLLKDYRVINIKFNRSLIPFYIRWGLALTAFVSILVIIPATMSRASWIALFAGCAVVILMQLSQNQSLRKYLNRRRTLATIFIASVVAAGIIGLFGAYILKKDSADGRLLIWKVSTQTISCNLTGVGLGRFAGVYGEFQSKYFKSDRATEQEIKIAECPDYAFNEYLHIGVETGIISSILFIAMLCAVIKKAYQRRQAGELGMIVSFSTFAFMSYPLNILPFAILLVYILAMIANDKGTTRTNVLTYILLGLSLILTAFAVFDRYPTYNAYRVWSKLSNIHNMGIESVTEDYAKLAPILSDNKLFLFEYAQTLLKSERYEESNQIINNALFISRDPMFLNVMGNNYIALGEYLKAEECFIESTYMTPNRMYPHYLLAKLFFKMGDTLRASDKARFVLNMHPKVSSHAITEMKTEMKLLLNEN